jgi:hypothetical protein
MKEANGRCPECGSGNFFARNVSENGMPLRNPAAPRCFDCGYPAIQSGSKTSPQSSQRAAVNGPVARARQTKPNHAVKVVLENGGTMIFPAAR